MRLRIGMAAAALASVTGLVLLTIGTAAATGRDRPQQAGADHPAGQGTARPGNNGTVKIHNGADEASPITRNEPHVCTFHIQALGFDAAQVLTFEVISWPPTGARSTVLTGQITADSAGAGRAPARGAYSLPNGHYRLVVDTGNGTPTQDKHKMFWVDCPPVPTTPGGGNGDTPSSPGNPPTSSAADITSSPAPPSSPGNPPTSSAGDITSSPAPSSSPPATSPAAAAATSPADAAPAQPGATRLASTGLATLSPLTIAGAGLLAVGLLLAYLSRRRPASLHRSH